MTTALSVSEIGRYIYFVRGKQVMLDRDLANFYQVTPKRLNEQVRRNTNRFPEDFMFQLIEAEYESFMQQSGAAKGGRGEHRKYLPSVFTAEGIAMLSSVLNSDRAIEVNIAIMRAFAEFRRESSNNMNVTLRVIEEKFSELDQKYERLSKIVLEGFEKLTSLPSRENVIFKKRHHVEVETILKTVANYFSLSVVDIKMPNRTKGIVLPRQIAIYLVRKQTQLSLTDIGKHFDGKDHTTILHACRKIEVTIAKDKEVRKAIEDIKNSVLNETYLN